VALGGIATIAVATSRGDAFLQFDEAEALLAPRSAGLGRLRFFATRFHKDLLLMWSASEG
jgi:hypothetical protein